MKRAVLCAVAGAFILGFTHATPKLEAQGGTPDALSFFKNYFVTGDYVLGGVGLRGKGVNGIATGTISISGVPAGADIAAAYLYWQAVGKGLDGADAGSLTATFNGRPLASADGPFGKVLGAGSAPCWSAGGGTGASGGTTKTYSYRADVLRLLDVDETTGKFIVNGTHQVQLPDGNGTAALGASLVVIYRDSTRPLSAIVLYDGTYTMDQNTQAMSQRIQGFYDPSRTSATMSLLVGSGQSNKSERLTFNGNPIAINPFQATAGASWDNPTFPVTTPGTGAPVTVGVDHDGFSSFDCLSWAAVVYKTEVKDSDGDGLLDAWEKSTAAQPILDPLGRPLPPLGDMGADPNYKDVFIEVGAMHEDVDKLYGGVTRPAHSHLPTHETLKMVGDAFKTAPEPIRMHFDVGQDYPAADPNDPTKNAEEYLIRGAGLARGGEQISEDATVCQRQPTDAPWICQFSDYPGTVGWKTGYRYLRDEVLSVTPPPGMPVPAPDEFYCDQPGYTCNRRFDETRRQMFRYVLFAHALGVPKSDQPCLDSANAPIDVDGTTGLCTVRDNPAFHVPVTNTGVGDYPGADVMLTLGAFSDVAGKPVGTPFMQASTLMHELGHNAQRRHGGDPAAPNCAPTYFSVMNYLYQLRGLLDNDGKPHLDFSRRLIPPAVDETALLDGSLSGLPYRMGWYAPLAGSYLDNLGLGGASKHCDGSSVKSGETAVIRVDARTAAGPIDWNANGTLDSRTFSLDVNFNGSTLGSNGAPEVLAGSDDWSNLLLNQIGVRRNTGGLYVTASGALAVGPLSLDSGRGDLGRGDLGRGDLGRGDLGRGDLGRGDLGRGDLGRGDLGRGDLGQLALGRGDLGRGDLGGGDLFLNDPANPPGELDYDLVVGTAKAPTNEFRACIIGVGQCAVPAGLTLAYPLHRVRLDWKPPNVGDVLNYTLYRVAGSELQPNQAHDIVRTVNAVLGQSDYTVVDEAQLVNGAPYTYFVIATYVDGTRSDLSNLVTITAINDAPAAANNTYSTAADTVLSVPAAGVLGNDTDDDSPIWAVLTAAPSHGALQLNANGSFTYTPATGFAGRDSFTYGATDGQATTTATVWIDVVRPLYGFIGVQNLPASKPANLGSSVPLRWQFTINGKVVNSAQAAPQIVIKSSAGAIVYRGDPTDPGASSFQPASGANGYTWGFNWQTKGLAAGTYQVYVGSVFTGQTFAAGTAFGPFAVALK